MYKKMVQNGGNLFENVMSGLSVGGDDPESPNDSSPESLGGGKRRRRYRKKTHKKSKKHHKKSHKKHHKKSHKKRGKSRRRR